ncbi:hypothetical protein DFH09DRAFT_1165841 [Mycena vulgaris]|nr:hypothetical protein DFH09DRAFT_1165841 [Mycena vulgaris]
MPRALDSRVEAALAETIRGEEVVDIKFYAYTRVGSSYVAHPRPMFARAALLRGHSDMLDTYLSGITSAEGFAESAMVDLDLDAPPQERFVEYDYMSDSDLDPDSDDDDSSDDGSLELGHPVENVSERKQEAIPSTSSVPKSVATSVDAPLRPAPSPPIVGPSTPRRMGRVVPVKDHAFKTWNAVLHYLYTKTIVFSTLGSESGFARPASTERRASVECSPKSMYRLADKFGLDDLKALALASLRSQLSAANIAREAFSNFTYLYPAIQTIEVEFLIRHLPDLEGEMDLMLRSVCDGARPRCFDVLRKVVFRTGGGPAVGGPAVGRPAVRKGKTKGFVPLERSLSPQRSRPASAFDWPAPRSRYPSESP